MVRSVSGLILHVMLDVVCEKTFVPGNLSV